MVPDDTQQANQAVGIGRPIELTEDEIVRDGELEDQSHPMTVSGHVAQPAQTRSGRAPGDVAAADGHSSRPDGAHTEQRLDQLILAVAFNAGNTDDCSRSDGKVDAYDVCDVT